MSSVAHAGKGGRIARTPPLQALFAAVGGVVALASGYELLVACSACQAASTGMPTAFSKALSVLGLLFGLSLFALATPWRSPSNARLRACEGLVLAALAVGGALLVGVVSGVYRFCPVCVVVWSAVGLAALGIVASGSRGARSVAGALAAVTLAAALVRFDRTTAQGLTALLPRADLASGCIGDVLTPDDLRALKRLGVPEGVPVLFVAHCSPCAAATVGHLLAKSPSTKVVAGDDTLATKVDPRRLIVYPPLTLRAARLGANVHRAVLRDGRITECKSNISALD